MYWTDENLVLFSCMSTESYRTCYEAQFRCCVYFSMMRRNTSAQQNAAFGWETVCVFTHVHRRRFAFKLTDALMWRLCRLNATRRVVNGCYCDGISVSPWPVLATSHSFTVIDLWLLKGSQPCVCQRNTSCGRYPTASDTRLICDERMSLFSRLADLILLMQYYRTRTVNGNACVFASVAVYLTHAYCKWLLFFVVCMLTCCVAWFKSKYN